MSGKSKLEVQLSRHFTPTQFDMPDDRLGFRLQPQAEANAAPTSWSFCDPDLLPGCYPLPGHAFRQIKSVFVRIFQHQHPAHQQWNGLLRRNTIKSRVAGNATYLTGGPASACVRMIPVRIQK